MIAQKYSDRLGVIRDEQIEAGMDYFKLGHLIEAKPIVFGNWGQNIYVCTTVGQFVLRGAPHFPWQFPTEQYFIRAIHEQTSVPVAWPYLINDSEDIFGWPYVVMPWLSGVQLVDPHVRNGLAHEERLEIAGALGRTLAQLHTLRWPEAGRYDLNTATIQPFERGYDQWIFSEIERIARSCFDKNFLQEADVTWIETKVKQANSAFDDVPPPSLVMGDYHENNVVVQRVRKTWEVSGVFDFMTAHVGNPEADLCRLIAAYTEQNSILVTAFLDQYRSFQTPHPGFESRFLIYMLHESVVTPGDWTQG